MEQLEVSRDQILIVLANLLKSGIKGHKTMRYYNTRKNLNLFVEPKRHQLEIYSGHRLILGLYFDKDNVTWDSVTRGTVALKNHDTDILIRDIFERIRKEKKLNVISTKTF